MRELTPSIRIDRRSPLISSMSAFLLHVAVAGWMKVHVRSDRALRSTSLVVLITALMPALILYVIRFYSRAE